MARCAAAGRGVTNLPTAARGPNLYCSADGGLRLREVGVFNTTTTAVAVGLGVATALGTVAGAGTEYCIDDNGHTVLGIMNTSHSADGTVAAVVRQASLGAAIGAGVIWTFGENGLYRPEGTGNGVIITCPTGTAQFLDFYFEWTNNVSYSAEVLADTPIGYYRLGESSGFPQDSSGNAHHFDTVSGTPDFSQASLVASDTGNTAINFASGSSEYFESTGGWAIGNTLTLEALVKQTSATGDQAIFQQNGGSEFRISAGKIELLLANSHLFGSSTTTLVAGTTYHVAVTKTGSTVKYYQDGVDVTPTITDTTLPSNANNWRIGAQQFGEYFNGVIDEFAVYTTALSQARIQAHVAEIAVVWPPPGSDNISAVMVTSAGRFA